MSLLRRDASEAIQRRFLSPNHYGPLSELDQAFQAFSGALTSAMAMLHGPGHSVWSERNFPRGRTWRKNEDSRFDPDRLSRSNLVGLKLAELKASPSRPLCFQCGAPGHIANQCRNATLCFVCNRFGHRSPECGSLTAQQAPRAPIPSIGSETYQVSVRDSIQELEMEVSVLKHELAKVRQRRSEMELALTGITSQIHLSETKLTAIEAAMAARKCELSSHPDNQHQAESDTGFRIGELTQGKESYGTSDLVTDPSCSQRMSLSSSNSEFVENRSQAIENETHEADSIQDVKLVTAMVGINVASGLCEDDVEESHARYSTSNSNKQESNKADNVPVTPINPVTALYSNSVPVNSDRLLTIPITQVAQNSWVSQITRTKKKITSGSIELNKVPLSREEKHVQFKRVAMTGTERADKKGTTSKKVKEFTVLWLPANRECCAR